jgi:phage baseplate assembly protein gpV
LDPKQGGAAAAGEEEPESVCGKKSSSDAVPNNNRDKDSCPWLLFHSTVTSQSYSRAAPRLTVQYRLPVPTNAVTPITKVAQTTIHPKSCLRKRRKKGSGGGLTPSYRSLYSFFSPSLGDK